MSPATDLLERVERRYRDLEAYSDRGVVEASGFGGESRGTFVTAFSRPVSLDFSFDGESGIGVAIQCRLRSAGGETTLSCFGEDEEPDSLALGVAGASGATFGAAHVTSALLLPEAVGGWPVVDLVSARLLSGSSINDVECSVVEGLHPQADPPLTVTLCVGLQNALLYRVEQRYLMEGVEERLCITYTPELRRPTIG